ncbi:MAG: hypoxanthine phosphoribosyltransferase [Ruminococcus sp.]|nr:hypoxanthine phosphoribosyltransferase [Ruminococcus sp.]
MNSDTQVIDSFGYEGIKKVLITEDEIKAAVKAEGRRITEEYEGKPLLIAGLLKGSFIFAADLCREIKIPCEMGFMAASSYGSGSVSVGKVDITLDIGRDISGYHVIIAEDIIDTGRTLSEVCRVLRERKPLSLKVVTLLDKPSRREVDFKADVSLFTIPDVFVVGCGLDYGEKYRNLPYIAEAEL